MFSLGQPTIGANMPRLRRCHGVAGGDHGSAVAPRQADPTTQDKVLAKNADDTGLAVTWLHYRGPGTVTFEPMTSSIKSEGTALTGRAATIVSFSEPGEYVIRAVGDDGNLTNGANVTVTVRPADVER